MDHSFSFLVIEGMISYYYWKKKQILKNQLKIHALFIAEKEIVITKKSVELEAKDIQISQEKARNQQLNFEKSVIEAKYQKKLKAAEVKKKNLAKYRQKKKDTRSVKKQAEDIIGKGPKWLLHSCKELKSHEIGKPKGANGGGRKHPEKIHQVNDLFPQFCPGCNTSLEDQKAHLIYERILIASIQSDGVSDEDLQRILKRCEKFLPSLFVYLNHEGMPPDNNLAEQDLQKYAKQRERSQDFKSIEVTKHLVEYLSLYMTCEANGRDFHILLHDLLSGNLVDLREFLFGKSTN
ncbi:MAG: hypothetical protein K9W44_04745 [Candidatus Lokiarchaeota archaeon]|nr:hypothetical protein [Candidatus Harpocratesius repetitus]